MRKTRTKRQRIRAVILARKRPTMESIKRRGMTIGLDLNLSGSQDFVEMPIIQYLADAR